VQLRPPGGWGETAAMRLGELGRSWGVWRLGWAHREALVGKCCPRGAFPARVPGLRPERGAVCALCVRRKPPEDKPSAAGLGKTRRDAEVDSTEGAISGKKPKLEDVASEDNK